MEILEYILWGVLGLVGLYLAFRVLSMAVFKSWRDVKLQTKERRKNDGDNGSD